VVNYTYEQLEDRFTSVPEDIQFALVSEDNIDQLEEIGRKNNFPPEKIDALIDETGLVMLGLTHPGSYVTHLSTRLFVDKVVAQKIAGEVNTIIFKPIKQSLEKIHNIEKGKPIPLAPKEMEQSIWQKMTQKNTEESERVLKEMRTKELKVEKGEILEQLIDINNRVHGGEIKNRATLEVARGQAMKLQNNITNLDKELQSLRN